MCAVVCVCTLACYIIIAFECAAFACEGTKTKPYSIIASHVCGPVPRLRAMRLLVPRARIHNPLKSRPLYLHVGLRSCIHNRRYYLRNRTNNVMPPSPHAQTVLANRVCGLFCFHVPLCSCCSMYPFA